jgi:hypothetical protein
MQGQRLLYEGLPNQSLSYLQRRSLIGHRGQAWLNFDAFGHRWIELRPLIVMVL